MNEFPYLSESWKYTLIMKCHPLISTMFVDPVLPLCNLCFSVFYDEITPTMLNQVVIPI